MPRACRSVETCASSKDECGLEEPELGPSATEATSWHPDTAGLGSHGVVWGRVGLCRAVCRGKNCSHVSKSLGMLWLCLLTMRKRRSRCLMAPCRLSAALQMDPTASSPWMSPCLRAGAECFFCCVTLLALLCTMQPFSRSSRSDGATWCHICHYLVGAA